MPDHRKPTPRQPFFSHRALAWVIAGLFMLGGLAVMPGAWALPDHAPDFQAVPTLTPTPNGVSTDTPVPTSTPVPTATPTAPACGPTEVTGGQIIGDVIWYRACSPFTVSSNVVVAAGARLMIEPGVEVRFASGKGLQINGTLVARGTEVNPIVFTSAQANPVAGDWVNIFFADASLDATFGNDNSYISGFTTVQKTCSTLDKRLPLW